MLKGTKLAVFVILAVSGSRCLASYLDGRTVSLPGVAAGITSVFEGSELVPVPMSPAPAADPGRVLAQNKEIEPRKALPLYGCRVLSPGEVEPQHAGGIYTWTDDQGVAHFSDVKPDNQLFRVHDLAGELIFDYFELNFVGNDVPADFKNKLNGKITKLFSFYGQILDKNALRKTAVNLRFFTSKEAFNRYRITNAPRLTANAPGFYSTRTNEAAIMFVDADSAMATAMHETSHAVARSIIGYSNRWLDEGVAEYLETIETVLKSSIIAPNSAWYYHNKFRQRLLPLSRVFNASDKDWSGALSSRLYATSWAFIYFLMASEQGKASLARLVDLEQQNPCDRLDLAQIHQALNTDVNLLQQRFSAWFDHGNLHAHQW